MYKTIKIILAVAMLICMVAIEIHAYGIGASANANSNFAANKVRWAENYNYGVTSLNHDTGWVDTQTNFPRSASSRVQVSVDFETGKIKIYGAVNGGLDGVAGASGQITDTLVFHLPGNMVSADIGFSFKIEGTHTKFSNPNEPVANTGGSGHASIRLGSKTVSSGNIGPTSGVLNQTFTGTTTVHDGLNIYSMLSLFYPLIKIVSLTQAILR